MEAHDLDELSWRLLDTGRIENTRNDKARHCYKHRRAEHRHQERGKWFQKETADGNDHDIKRDIWRGKIACPPDKPSGEEDVEHELDS